jgi:geranylgeranyl diphosphate synthase type I
MTNRTIQIDEFFKNSKLDLEEKILKTISDEDINQIMEGGKRLRSILANLTFKACTGGNEHPRQYQKALEGGVSIELAHAASLVHDDIIDKDNVRRGKAAFHIKKGIASALLTGHKMLAKGFNIALSHGKEVAKLYVDSWDEVVNGEIDEVDFNKNDLKRELSAKSKIFEAYHKIIDQKTAALFSSACKAGAIEANMTGDILKVFADYGREIGLAYQIADDLVDLAKGEMLDSVIIPIVNRLENKKTVGALNKKIIRDKFRKHEKEIQKILMDEIKKHVKKAEELSKIMLLPKSEYTELLAEAPAWIINKMLREVSLAV